MAIKFKGDTTVAIINSIKKAEVDTVYRCFNSGVLLSNEVINHGDFVSWDGTKWIKRSDLSYLIDNTAAPIGQQIMSSIAPAYVKQPYPANSYVTKDEALYTSAAAIDTAEDWTPAHWIQTTVAEMMASIKTGYTTKNMAQMSGGAYHIPVKNRECVNVAKVSITSVSAPDRQLTIELEDDCTDAVINILEIDLGTMTRAGWTFEVTRGNNTLPIYGFDNIADVYVAAQHTDSNILTSGAASGSGYEIPESFDDVGLTFVAQDVTGSGIELKNTGPGCAICLEVKGGVVIVHQINGTSFR